mmetsp:Transcript_13846/g.19213  ORF Transcript_13846/g.19213 Transcript_13846/m.19213 type:complete len:127 (-) Transcript_13846:208-588(-)
MTYSMWAEKKRSDNFSVERATSQREKLHLSTNSMVMMHVSFSVILPKRHGAVCEHASQRSRTENTSQPGSHCNLDRSAQKIQSTCPREILSLFYEFQVAVRSFSNEINFPRIRNLEERIGSARDRK